MSAEKRSASSPEARELAAYVKFLVDMGLDPNPTPAARKAFAKIRGVIKAEREKFEKQLALSAAGDARHRCNEELFGLYERHGQPKAVPRDSLKAILRRLNLPDTAIGFLLTSKRDRQCERDLLDRKDGDNSARIKCLNTAEKQGNRGLAALNIDDAIKAVPPNHIQRQVELGVHVSREISKGKRPSPGVDAINFLAGGPTSEAVRKFFAEYL